jgi:hypothetical protein
LDSFRRNGDVDENDMDERVLNGSGRTDHQFLYNKSLFAFFKYLFPFFPEKA